TLKHARKEAFAAMAVGFGMSPPAYASFPNPGPTKMEGFTGVNYASAEAGIRMSTVSELNHTEKKTLNNLQVERNGEEIDMQHMFAERRYDHSVVGASGKLQRHGSPVEGPPRRTQATEPVLIKILLPHRSGHHGSPPREQPVRPAHGRQTKVQRLMDMYAATLTSLHGMGARKFGVINVGLIGCVPSVQGSSGHGGGCDESMNRLAAEFNAALGPLLSGLAAKLHRFRYSLADFYGFSNATFANPSAAGFSNIISACCEGPCTPNPYFRAPCSNRKDYWFWDDGYMTEQAAKVTAAAFYSGKAFTTPLNFKRLIAMKG
ncbi:hypothetical protein EJB05_24149, partial [Eragrostis curvula]